MLEFKFFQSDEPNLAVLLRQAADAFAEEHIGLPEEILINPFRLITQARAELWGKPIRHGAIPIRLVTPYDSAYPELRTRYVPYDIVICVRGKS